MSNSASGSVSVISTETLESRQETIPLGGRPLTIAIAGQRAFVLNDDSVSVFCTETLEVFPAIPVPGQPGEPSAITIAGQQAFVVNMLSGTVAVIDTAALKLIDQPIKVANYPLATAVAGQRAFVMHENNLVTVLEPVLAN